MAGAVNLLQECVVTMTFAQTDQGGGETYGGPITFKVDKIGVKDTIASSDHGTAQDAVGFERMDKNTWQLDIDTKLYDADLLAALKNNALGAMIVTSRTGTGVNAPAGLICDVDIEYANPSTMKFSLKNRGVPLQYT